MNVDDTDAIPCDVLADKKVSSVQGFSQGQSNALPSEVSDA